MSKRKPPMVFITGPWKLNNPSDLAEAIACVSKALEAGYYPVCPFLMLYYVLSANNPADQARYRAQSAEMLGRCRVVVVCGNCRDETVNADISMAIALNITVVKMDGLISAQNKAG